MTITAERIAAALPHDKALHIILGLLVALAGLAAGHLLGWLPLLCALVACVAAALIREATNASGWSWPDIAWTVAGSVPVIGAAWVGA